MKRGVAWPDSWTAKLKEVANARPDATYEELRWIIDPSGGLTRSAIAGKLRRLGLRDCDSRTVVANAQRVRKRVMKKKAPEPKARFPKKVETAFVPEVEPLPVEDTTLQPTRDYAALEFDECKWPYGDTPPFQYCGRKRDKLEGDRLHPYCPHHRARATRPKPEKRTNEFAPPRNYRADRA